MQMLVVSGSSCIQLGVGRSNRDPNGSKLYVGWAKVMKPKA
jgi:hypothetical protein